MCFNTKSSAIAWAISIIISIFLYVRNKNYDRWNSAFIMCFSTIQLLEAGIWSTNNMNELLTELILLALVFQPLVQSYAGYIYTKNMILALMSFVFLGIIFWSSIRILKAKSMQFGSKIGEKGHLVWYDTEEKENFLGGTPIVIWYMAGLLLPLLFMKNSLPLIITGITTLLYSSVFAGKGEIGSYWCFTAVIYSIVSIFV